MEDLHDRWPHRWISPKVKVKESKIHGLGTFTTEPISKGEVVRVDGGIIVPKSNIEEYREIIGGIRGIQIDDDFFICPTEPKGGCYNHSCDANLGYKSSIVMIATKDIKAGEEVAIDYSYSEANIKPFSCNCGSKICRKTITSNDWKNPEFQEKFKEYFTPYIKSKIDGLN